MAPTASTNEPTRSTQSNSAGSLPIFAAKYKDRAIAIRKTSDYITTITSVRTAFQIPSQVSDSQIRLSSRFDDFDGLLVELTSDIWDDVLPLLRIVEVSTSMQLPRLVVATNSVEPQYSVNGGENIAINNTSMTVHVVGGPFDLTVPISETCTLSNLKKLVFQRINHLPSRITFHLQDTELNDNSKQLHTYGVVDQSIITLMTTVQVYVTTPQRSKVPMRVTLYAGVSSLKLLIHSRLDVPIQEQILMCAGEELVDGTRLGSYPQISHNSHIIVDVMPTGPDQVYQLLCVKVKPAWASDEDDEDEHMYYVLPTSTVLDLKVLIHDFNIISPSRQRLEFRGQTLEDEENMNEAHVESGSTLVMHIASQRT